MPAPFETAFGLLRNAGICRVPEERSVSKDTADVGALFYSKYNCIAVEYYKVNSLFYKGIFNLLLDDSDC